MRRYPHVLLACVLFAFGCTGEQPTSFVDSPTTERPILSKNGEAFPEVIVLPDDFGPEGIAVGEGHTFYVGSVLGNGFVRGDLRTGSQTTLGAGTGGIVGIDVDSRSGLLFAAGGGPAILPGTVGDGRVYDASTGDLIATHPFGAGFVNDVVVTRTAAYFTDSFDAQLYRVDLDKNGRLAGDDFSVVPLSGFSQPAAAIGANGIVATPNGRWLIIVHSSDGDLYRVDPATGDALVIDLDGDTVTSGDGLALEGKTLYVVQNGLAGPQQIAVVRLEPDYRSGSVVGAITDPRFATPTTAETFGSSLLVVNAKFADPDASTFEIVRVDG